MKITASPLSLILPDFNLNFNVPHPFPSDFFNEYHIFVRKYKLLVKNQSQKRRRPGFSSESETFGSGATPLFTFGSRFVALQLIAQAV